MSRERKNHFLMLAHSHTNLDHVFSLDDWTSESHPINSPYSLTTSPELAPPIECTQLLPFTKYTAPTEHFLFTGFPPDNSAILSLPPSGHENSEFEIPAVSSSDSSQSEFVDPASIASSSELLFSDPNESSASASSESTEFDLSLLTPLEFSQSTSLSELVTFTSPFSHYEFGHTEFDFQ
ncbi:5563_t:CDS:1 [Acaulospora colombiana]|uniref:5563_t:CDS:1 n=1 Tax=Acaulospora colombiana TaxID=27376 RepID=A0ACA9KED7_9GLOM|nr:5563_t:CDS:1 [Acaulospora colombiana]